MKTKVLLTLFALTLSSACLAQDDAEVLRPPAVLFTGGIGSASVLDTYLSTVTYGGVATSLAYEHTQAMGGAPDRWIRQLRLGVDFNATDNRHGNNDTYTLLLHARWSPMCRFRFDALPKLQVMVGPMTQLRGGIHYNEANSNNIVNAKIHWSVGAQAMAVLNTRLGRLPVTLRYNAGLPLLGVFFTPEYDESYYEIYLGNRKKLVRFGSPACRFDLDHEITADLHLGSTIVRVGYRNLIERSWVSHINTHVTTHSLVVGIGGEYLAVGRKGLPAKARIVSAQY